MKYCGFDDCPETHDKIIGRLCDLHYPYGGKVCRNQFFMWYGQEEEVRKLHEEYLERIGEKDNVIEIKHDKCLGCGYKMKINYIFCPICGLEVKKNI